MRRGHGTTMQTAMLAGLPYPQAGATHAHSGRECAHQWRSEGTAKTNRLGTFRVWGSHRSCGGLRCYCQIVGSFVKVNGASGFVATCPSPHGGCFLPPPPIPEPRMLPVLAGCFIVVAIAYGRKSKCRPAL